MEMTQEGEAGNTKKCMKDIGHVTRSVSYASIVIVLTL